MRRRIPLKRTGIKRTKKKSFRPRQKAIRRTPRKSTEQATVRIEDSTSPDRCRVVMCKADWDATRKRLAEEVALNLCEGCLEQHYLPFGPAGQAHHIYGRGAAGARRDDRIFVPLQSLATEPNLAKWQERRNLVWTCSRGHERLEKLSTKTFRQSLTSTKCSCGQVTLRAPTAGASPS